MTDYRITITEIIEKKNENGTRKYNGNSKSFRVQFNGDLNSVVNKIKSKLTGMRIGYWGWIEEKKK